MVRIRDVMMKNEEERFVGRSRELALLRKELAADHENWRLVHLHGPGGIGKTGLLRSFARETGEATVWIGGEEQHAPHDFLNRLRMRLIEKGWELPVSETADDGAALAEVLNREAVARQGFVLILDSFEECKPIEKWLRDFWLPRLSVRVRVCTAGRYPLEGEWLRAPGWTGLVYNLKLGPLNRSAIYRYTRSRGIQDHETRDAIERFSKGIPLALTLACDAVLRNGPEVLREGSLQRQMIQSLCTVLLQDLKNSFEKQLLDAASIFWRFDQEMLEEVAGQEIPDEAFREFTGLPFVSLSDEGGWSVVDAVRDWIKADLRNRAPETYDLYRRKALFFLQRRLAAAPADLKRQLMVELLYLHDNELLRNYGFRGQGERFQVEVRAADDTDLPAMGKMYRDWTSTIPPYLPDETHQESYFRAVWEAEPSSFTVFWADGRLAAFYALVPLKPETRSIFQENPIFRAYLSQSPLQEKEYLIWLGCKLPDFDPSIFGYLLRYLLLNLADKLITTLTPIAYFADIYASIGFQRLPWADSRYTNGTPVRAYQLDLRERELSDPLTERLFSDNPKGSVSVQEISVLLKKALNDSQALELEPHLLRTLQGSNKIRQMALTEGSVAAAVRKALSEGLEQMSRGTEEDQLLAQAIRLAYIQKIGKHEVVAARLSLSPSTYYRYLKKGFERLAHDLITE
ncbi:AAA family ATPase [Cohnella massiliensis]|uniref:AAA family ATPase n=1 Tax=Cohnella massiliensis TaxID=1816691 RepID=UPI0009B96309|nr:ATP-binding protein [Cohnella massiliensis]